MFIDCVLVDLVLYNDMVLIFLNVVVLFRGRVLKMYEVVLKRFVDELKIINLIKIVCVFLLI